MNEVGIKIPVKKMADIQLRDITSLVVAITIFLSISPFFVWSSFAGGIGGTIFKAFQLLATGLLFLHLLVDRFTMPAFISGVGILGIFLFYCFFTGVKSGTTHPLLIGNVLVYVFYALNALADKRILVKSFDLLRTIFAIFLGYTFIIYLLILIGIPVPYSVLQSGEAGRVEAGYQFYQNYLGCIVINQNGSLLYRFTAVFTEPGVVGTFCAFFLASDDCVLKGNKRNIIFLISGLFSLSLAFYVMFVLIIAMKSLRNGGFKLFISLLAIVAVYFVFINASFSNPMIVSLQERLVLTESGLAGDNRIKEAAEASYQAFLNSDIKTVLLGYGYPDSTATAEAWQATASYKESVYCLGVLGYGLMLAWFIITPLICYKSKNKNKNRLMYSYMAIFILSQYQRPYMKGLFLAYILLAGCLYVQRRAKD